MELRHRDRLGFEFAEACPCIEATNVFGQRFMLQDFLKFGITVSETESGMDQSVSDRKTAAAVADMPLHNYDTETAVLQAGETRYLALVLRMPEEVDNFANYRGQTVPKVELGITVKADQIKD